MRIFPHPLLPDAEKSVFCGAMMEHELRTQLLAVASGYSDATGATLATIGKRALNDNRFFQRIEDGHGFTVKTFDRVVGWLSANWPAGLAWPDEVSRPLAHVHESANAEGA